MPYINTEWLGSNRSLTLCNMQISEETRRFFEIEIIKTKAEFCWLIPIHDANGMKLGNVVRNTRTYEHKFVGNFRNNPRIFNLNRVLAYGKTENLTITQDIYDCIRLWQDGARNVLSLINGQLSKSQLKSLLSLLSPNKIRLLLSSKNLTPKIELQTIVDLASQTYIRVLPVNSVVS